MIDNLKIRLSKWQHYLIIGDLNSTQLTQLKFNTTLWSVDQIAQLMTINHTVEMTFFLFSFAVNVNEQRIIAFLTENVLLFKFKN